MTTTPQRAWKNWVACTRTQADDIDRAAELIELADDGPTPHGILGHYGAAAWDLATAAVREARRKQALHVRELAKQMRESVDDATWLGQPKRAAVLEAVVVVDKDEQEVALRKLPRATYDALGWSGKKLRRAYSSAERINRIVGGARLYAAYLAARG